jgi:rhodanese-related sulfurtransferase
MRWWWPFGEVPEIEARALHERLGARTTPQLIDVRSRAEYARGHVAGSLSVPITELKARLETLGLDRGRPVVAICLTAHRSIPAVRLLVDLGFDAAQLRGGMLAWRAQGLPEE